MPLPDAAELLVFCAAAFALIVVPGPAVFYIVARSVAQGPAAGIVSALGVGLGASLHVAAAALGVSALIMASATAFTVLELLGAGYLILLGIRTLLERDEAPAAVAGAVRSRSLGRVFLDGVVVNALNPKVALFFVAFLPQFVDPGAGSVPAQMVFLGALFVLIGIASDAVYAVLAGGLAGRLRASRRAARARRWFSGSVYLGLGVGTALLGEADEARA